MNFSFSKKDDDNLRRRLDEFHLFSNGRRRKIRNVLSGKAGELDVRVFDYTYHTGGNNKSRAHRQTVMHFEGDQLDLPRFALRPERLYHRIGQVFGYQDIDFDTNPKFSASYLLRGEDERSVRDLFSDEALTFYEGSEKLSTEAAGRHLIHYRARKRVKPNALEEFIKQGVRVLTLFHRG